MKTCFVNTLGDSFLLSFLSFSSAWQNVWPEDWPADCVLLPQASGGHCKRGRQDRWGALTAETGSDKSGVCWRKSMDFRLFAAGYHQLCFSRWLLTPPLHSHTYPASLCLLPNFSQYLFYCFIHKGHETAGMVSVRAVYEIAQVKTQDECFKIRNTALKNVVKSIIGSARSLGIKVVNE